MATTTLIYLLIAIVAVLVLLVVFLVWRMSRKDDELQRRTTLSSARCAATRPSSTAPYSRASTARRCSNG